MKKIFSIVIIGLFVSINVNAQSFERILNPDYFIDDPLIEDYLYPNNRSFESKKAFFIDTFLVSILHHDVTKYIVGEDFSSENFDEICDELRNNSDGIEDQINNCHWYDLDRDGDLDVIINIYYDDYKEGIIYLAFKINDGSYIYHQVPGILITDAFYSKKIPNKVLSYDYAFDKPLIKFEYFDISGYEGPKNITSLYVPILLRKPLDEEYLSKPKDYTIVEDSTYIYNEPEALLDTNAFTLESLDKQRLSEGKVVTAVAKVFYSGNFWLFIKAKTEGESDSEIWGWINAVNTDY